MYYAERKSLLSINHSIRIIWHWYWGVHKTTIRHFRQIEDYLMKPMLPILRTIPPLINDTVTI